MRSQHLNWAFETWLVGREGWIGHTEEAGDQLKGGAQAETEEGPVGVRKGRVVRAGWGRHAGGQSGALRKMTKEQQYESKQGSCWEQEGSGSESHARRIDWQTRQRDANSW